jgi:hypothetical protein
VYLRCSYHPCLSFLIFSYQLLFQIAILFTQVVEVDFPMSLRFDCLSRLESIKWFFFIIQNWVRFKGYRKVLFKGYRKVLCHSLSSTVNSQAPSRRTYLPFSFPIVVEWLKFIIYFLCWIFLPCTIHCMQHCNITYSKCHKVVICSFYQDNWK